MDAALIILDGWALADHDRLDAVRSATTPHFDQYRSTGLFRILKTWGESVGLPKGGMGNSEVGHLTIGAGRVVPQARTRINQTIADGSFSENPAIQSAFDHISDGGRLHLMGLVSDAGVHADDSHLHSVISLAGERDVEAVTHAFTDGRDTPPTAGLDYIQSLEDTISEEGTGDVATVAGRYFAMDRDENWERTFQAYSAIVDRDAEHETGSAKAAVETAYERGETDEFIVPTIITGGAPLSDGDAVILLNFRADRMRQLVRMLCDIRPEWSVETNPPSVHAVTMTEYDETFELPVAFSPPTITHTLGEVLADHGKTQLRIAETEKYAHVTYFLNGGRENVFPGEHREIVPSPAVPTYDEKPEMSAREVTDTAIGIISEEIPDVLVLNYANPDMVGHTGNFSAAVVAIETVDTQLGRLVDVLQQHDADVIITADHGNADDMGTPENPHTAHTYNPVPFIYLTPDSESSKSQSGTEFDAEMNPHERIDGGLSDIAPTILFALGIEQPAEMTGESLVG